MREYVYRLMSIVIICFVMVMIGAIDQMTKDALKVEHLLSSIEKLSSRTGVKEYTAEVTEKELNAYITYRLAREKSPLINSLKINLLDNNNIRGKIRLDAQQLNLNILLGDDLDFDFQGIVYTRDGKGRLDLITLKLRGQPVNPQVLDLVLSTVALYYGTESRRIGDWYDMPEGINRIMVNKGRAMLYY